MAGIKLVEKAGPIWELGSSATITFCGPVCHRVQELLHVRSQRVVVLEAAEDL